MNYSAINVFSTHCYSVMICGSLLLSENEIYFTYEVNMPRGSYHGISDVLLLTP